MFRSKSKDNSSLQGLFNQVDALLDFARKMFTQSESMKRVVANEKAAVETSSSASHEISSMVTRTAHSAKELSDVALASHQALGRSEKGMENLTRLIQQVNSSSSRLQATVTEGLKEISSVTTTLAEIREKAKMIHEIVFQTKLLSFNASVEAARAGEHGRGFSVVAEEMGNLARASGAAAKEIETILEQSMTRTNAQISQVTKELETVAAETVGAIASVSSQSAEISASFKTLAQHSKDTEVKSQDISSATNEQSIGVSEISRSLQELEKSSHELDHMAVSSHQSAAELATKVEGIAQEFLKVANTLGFSIKPVEKPFDFNAALSAHIDWKMKLTKYVERPDGSLDHTKVGVDNACVLGKWLYGDGQKFHEIDPKLFDSVRESHAAFHKTAGEIIRLVNEGKIGAAEKMLGAGGPYLAVSEKTVALISKLKEAVEGHTGSSSKAA